MPHAGTTAPRAGSRPLVAFVHPAPIGSGGLGRLAEDALRSLAEQGAEVHAFGPATPDDVRARLGSAVTWHVAAATVPRWAARYTWLRWYSGQHVMIHSVRLGRWAAREVAALGPTLVYGFAEVSLETLRWARGRGIATILDNPTGDVRHYRAAGVDATKRWGGRAYRAHPTPAMVRRVAEEYALADRIRVASTFSRASMVANGVAAPKVHIVAYPIDVRRFAAPASRPAPSGPLRICSVGTITLAKGFPVLLEAVRRLGPEAIDLRLVGGTDSRLAHRVLTEVGQGIRLTAGPVHDIREAYQGRELFVLPTLHDGYGFVVAEAMASGLPAIVTATCGAGDLLEPGRTGWIVREDDVEALAAALGDALRRRGELATMGEAARRTVMERAAGDDLGAWALGLAARR